MKKSSNTKSKKARKHSSKSNPINSKKNQKIDKYEQSKPVQLELFELMNPTEQDYTNTIELYDFIPKYVWGKLERIQEKFLEPIEREFNCRGQAYSGI